MELTPTQKLLLESLKFNNLHHQFYWTGGTLLSFYYLKHRLSYDLDFFTQKPFSFTILLPYLNHVKHSLKIQTIKQTKIYDRWEFIIEQKEITRFEFVYYNHQKKQLKPFGNFQEIPLDSLDDIAANKVLAYFDRNEPKDLFDIYTLLIMKKYTLNELLALVEKKFEVKFSPFLFWSEATKSLKLLTTLKPYLLEKDKPQQNRRIKNINTFFLSKGKEFLDNEIG